MRSNLFFLVRNDYRLAYRDPILRFLLAVPLLILLLIWFVMPLLFLRFPPMENFRHLLLMWACLQTPVMFGFINSFIYLEEKEQSIHQALEVLPLSAGSMLLMRNLLGMALSFALNLLLLLSNGLMEVALYPGFLVALQYSLLAPSLSLIMMAFTQNKVQGMAHFKIYNMLAILPALVYIMPYRWMHVLALIPTYWSYKTIALLAHGAWLQPLLIGYLHYGVLQFVLLYLLKKKNL